MPTKGARTKERIIQAALDLFADQGFTATSIRDIAAQAGLTHAGLLHHFADKDDLLVQLLAYREEQDELGAMRYAQYGIDKLFAWILDIVRINAADPSRVMLFVRLSGEAIDPGHPAHAYFARRYERILDALDAAFAGHFAVVPPRLAVTPREAAISIVALIDGLQVQWLLRPDTLDMTALVRTHLLSLGIEVPDTSGTKDLL